MNYEDLYFPLPNFIPPAKEQLTLHQCMISKTQEMIEKHTTDRKFAKDLAELLKENGITYFDKLLAIDLKEIGQIKGLSKPAFDIIRKIREENGIKEEK